MKYLLFIILISYISCTKKEIITPQTDSNILISSKLVVNLDSTVLSITLMPYLHCYSLKENKPCIILVEATVTLSKAIQKNVRFELVQNDNEVIGMVLNKGFTSEIINTLFPLQTNVVAPPDIYKIRNVVLFNLFY